jgi:N-formylglutamate deformylase
MRPGVDDSFPVLISVPHAGTEVPPELEGRIDIGPDEIFDECDAFAREIYGAADCARFVLDTAVARTFVDLNRAEDDLPPANPDGAVKSHTSYNRAIYRAGHEPDAALVERLLERYHRPYHRTIQAILADQGAGLELALDCHSMAPVGPDLSPDPGRRRPTICLGNVRGRACPPATTDRLAGCFARAFGLPDHEVARNRPFGGGHITRTYGGRPVPWVQVELSRDLYLRPPHFDRESLTMDPARLRALSAMFREVLRQFFCGSR